VIDVIGLRDIFIGAFMFIVALSSAVAVLNRWIILPLQRADRRVASEIVTDELDPIRESLDQIHASLQDIRYEVRINSGGSLKDTVIQIQRDLVRLQQDFTSYKEHHQ
jgi:hypothetical protein